MAKNDNIQDLLHDVAEAIRVKKGTADLINPQDFSKEIAEIESGTTEVEYAFGETLTSYGDAFNIMKTVKIKDGVSHISDKFLILPTIEIIIPDSVISIGNYAFRDSKITSIILPKNLQSIGIAAFYGCSSLTSIEIPRGVTIIRGNLFSNCTSLTSVFMLGEVTTIDNWAFSNTGLQQIEIPQTVSRINLGAFNSCGKLKHCFFLHHTSVPTLANVNAFGGTTCQFIVPDALYDEWIAATNWSTYADRIVKASEYQPNNE